VTQPTAHLERWTLDELAEGTLSNSERVAAEEHLRRCSTCTDELDAARAVIAALGALPHFDPSPMFADGVMARVVLPGLATAPAAARRRRWAPQSRRGWMLVLAAVMAPLAPLFPFLAWVFGHPGVTPGALLGVARNAAVGASVRGAEWLARSGATEWVVTQGERIPGGYSVLAAFALAVLLAIPVSGWAMVRLLGTPNGGLAHAN
jgi:hypothetical protein